MYTHAITFAHVTIAYREIPIIWNLNATIPQGVLLAVVGPNGAGKTTLLKSIIGMITPIAGTIKIFDSPLSQARSRIAYIPQRSTIDWNFPATVVDIVIMGRYATRGWFKRMSPSDTDLVWQALDQVGLIAQAHMPINQLSGGQQQRVFLARALVQNPDLYLMDEPLAGIDAYTETQIMQTLQSLRSQGKTIVMVHHDVNTLQNYFDWMLILNNQTGIACGPVDQAYKQLLTHLPNQGILPWSTTHSF